jgi:hypothetical protein
MLEMQGSDLSESAVTATMKHHEHHLPSLKGAVLHGSQRLSVALEGQRALGQQRALYLSCFPLECMWQKNDGLKLKVAENDDSAVPRSGLVSGTWSLGSLHSNTKEHPGPQSSLVKNS